MSHTHPNAPPLPLAALRAFEAAARLGSFRDAAGAIGLTPSAISHHVRDLEGTLGTALFLRGHRSLALTEAGKTLAAELTPALARVAAAYRAARADRALRLSAAPLFAARFLLPRLSELVALLPGTRIEVESGIAPVDLAGGRYDLALRFGPTPEPALPAIDLGGGGLIVVGAATLLASTPHTGAAALAHLPLLSLTRHPNAWATLRKSLGQPGPGRELFFDSLEGILRGAETGLGLALVPPRVCQDQLRAGTLAQLLPHRFDNGWRYWLIAKPNALPGSQLETLATWLRQSLEQPL